MTTPTPLCTACLASSHTGSPPDFPHRLAAPGEACGAADHPTPPTMTTVQLDLKYAILTLNGANTPDTTRYVWDPEKILLPYGAGSVRLGKGDDNVSLSSLTLNDAWPEEPIFIFYCEDCAWPIFHAIQAASWEDAYEDFCEQEADRGHYLIKDGDPDYGPDDGHYCDDGRRVDSENFMSVGHAQESFRVVLAGSALPPRA